MQYFSAQVVDDILMISTTASFIDYERNEDSIFPGFGIQFTCTSGQVSTIIQFTIQEANNFAPEFTKTSYEVIVPTPLPVGLDIIYFMKSEGIIARDYDLTHNTLTFEISGSGSDIFKVESTVDMTQLKPEYSVKIITTQSILQIEGDEMTISIIATVNLL